MGAEEEEEEKEGRENEKLRQDVTILLAANRFGLVALSSETNRSHSSCRVASLYCEIGSDHKTNL